MGSTAEKRRFTYADYKNWPDDERWEIIDGSPFCMTPAPSIKHQRVLGNIHALFFDHFRNKPCRPFVAPTDVMLDDFNVVQPDLLVVCDPGKLTEANVQGAPDLVVEVLSPSTKLKDKREKKSLYERFGVREYLVVSPDDAMVEQYRLVDGRFQVDVFNWDEKLTLFAFPELVVNLWEIFEKEIRSEPSPSGGE